jgi:hypothetical protein
MGRKVEDGLGIRVMHYYVQGSRTGDGLCHYDYDDARAELLRKIVNKCEKADSYQLRDAAKAMGRVADWTGLYDNDSITVGSDTWRIIECSSYGCTDADRGSGDW